MARITSLGHACFTFSNESQTLLFDPWLSGNPEAVCSADEVHADAILVTHGHSDHLGDAIAVAKRLSCPIIAAYELCMYCARHGCEVEPMHIGGARQFDFGMVKLTPALHGSAVITDTLIEYTGPAVGFIVTLDEITLYFAGDTGLFGDMKLIGELYEPQVAILPIGDNFTMGPRDAVVAAEMIRPRIVIPSHYSAFEIIQQDPESFARSIETEGIACRILRPGETTEITAADLR